jgi:hypothetical protein
MSHPIHLWVGWRIVKPGLYFVTLRSSWNELKTVWIQKDIEFSNVTISIEGMHHKVRWAAGHERNVDNSRSSPRRVCIPAETPRRPTTRNSHISPSENENERVESKRISFSCTNTHRYYTAVAHMSWPRNQRSFERTLIALHETKAMQFGKEGEEPQVFLTSTNSSS